MGDFATSNENSTLRRPGLVIALQDAQGVHWNLWKLRQHSSGL